jgi:hypothetical protein
LTRCGASHREALFRRFEQLDRIAVGIIELYLSSTRAGLHVVAKLESSFLQPFNARGKIRDAKNDTIPATRLLTLTVGQRTGPRRLRSAEQKPQFRERHIGKCGELLMFELESEMFSVEGNAATYVTDLIPNAVEAPDECLRSRRPGVLS